MPTLLTRRPSKSNSNCKTPSSRRAARILNDLGRAFTDSGTAADRWKNFVSHAIQDVMSAFEGLAKQLLTGALNSLFGGAGGATLGSIFGGGSSAILGPLAGSPMVLGGGGGMGVGDWAIVGERGPELVYADTPGNVLSADRTRGIFGSGSGGDGDTHFHIDARGADMARGGPDGASRCANCTALSSSGRSLRSPASGSAAAPSPRRSTGDQMPTYPDRPPAGRCLVQASPLDAAGR